MSRYPFTKPAPGTERLERLKRWPGLKRKWASRSVLIWSGEHRAYWRKDGCGYTTDSAEAGVYDFEDALTYTYHCDPSKQICYELIPMKNQSTLRDLERINTITRLSHDLADAKCRQADFNIGTREYKAFAEQIATLNKLLAELQVGTSTEP
jgi:hypothetical protein